MSLEVTLYILGGAYGPKAQKELGASCDILKVKRGNKVNFFMIDAGLDLAGDTRKTFGNPPCDLDRLEEILDGHPIDHLLLTHAHTDHAGCAAWGTVEENLADGKRIICTRPTAAFVSENLNNQLAQLKRLRKARMIDKLPFTAREIFLTQRRLYDPILRPEPLEIADDVWIYPPPAGHMLGACSYTFRIIHGRQKVNLMFSGDRACHDQLTTRGAPLSSKEWYPDIIASYDCTNGGEDLAQGGSEANFWVQEMARLMAVAKRCHIRKEWFFASAFAMERFPTVARALADIGLPVYGFSPSADVFWQITNSDDGTWCDRDRPLDRSGVEFLERLEDAANLLDPTALIASSGMGHGPAADCHFKFLPMADATDASTGFAAEDTNNFRIASTEYGKEVKLRIQGYRGVEKEILVKVLARREKFRLTGHSLRETAARSAEELLRYSQFKKPTIGLKHGPTPALDWFESRLCGFRTFRQDRPEDRTIQLL